MDAAFKATSNRLIAKLDATFALSDDERKTLVAMPMQAADLRADQDIVREGDRPSRSCLVLEGFACTYKLTGSGKRQIQAFHVPGDMPDLHSLHLRMLDNSVMTISPCRVGFIQHEVLRELCERSPRIAAALWRQTLIDAAVFREWMTCIGRREGYSRMAHLFCELLVRMRAVGLATDYSCRIPITQTELGDALGLSTVHVNRVLQELRSDGLIVLQSDLLIVPDWEKLTEAGDFDPLYLHQEREPEAA